jgi:hypothetical protein
MLESIPEGRIDSNSCPVETFMRPLLSVLRACLKLIAFPAIAALSSAHASAQSDANTPVKLTLGFYAEHTGGALASCNITFDAVTRDYAYRAGRPVLLDGSIGLMAKDGKLFFVSKVVPSDAAMGADGAPILTTFTPPLIYYSFKGVSTIGQELRSFRCDAGGVCAAYKLDRLMQPFMESIDFAGGFEVAYEREAGALDVTTSIAVPVLPGDPSPSYSA